MIDFSKLTAFELQAGAHDTAAEGLCAMEAVAWLEGVEHSDRPSCTCPVIAAFVRSINDRMPDSDRQKLVAYLPRLVGTVSPRHEQERAEYLAWHAITVVAPVVLERAGLKHHAATLRGLGRHDWEAAAFAANAASYAAANAAAADASADWEGSLTMLDDMLAIGPQSAGFSADTEARVAAYRELVAV